MDTIDTRRMEELRRASGVSMFGYYDKDDPGGPGVDCYLGWDSQGGHFVASNSGLTISRPDRVKIGGTMYRLRV